MTMIERAAHALSELDHSQVSEGISTESECSDFYRTAARAVLQAIREPSEGMIEAAVLWLDGEDFDIGQAWRAAIDAALSE